MKRCFKLQIQLVNTGYLVLQPLYPIPRNPFSSSGKMGSLQIQDGPIERWSTATSHDSGYTSYFSITNVAGHIDQKAFAPEHEVSERRKNRETFVYDNSSPVEAYFGSGGKDSRDAGLEIAVQEEEPRQFSSSSSMRKSPKRTHLARNPKTESSVSTSVKLDINPSTPAAVSEYSGGHDRSTKIERRLRGSQDHKSYCNGSRPMSDRRSATNPFPSHHPTRLASSSLSDTLTGWYSYPDIVPLISESTSMLAHNSSPIPDTADAFPFLDMSCEKDHAPYHPPQPVIDWTSPATRRREYEEIDRSRRGIRGIWRKMSPRWCQRNRRLSFHNEQDGSDGGSVRRYRVPIPDEENGEISALKGGVQVSQTEVQLPRPKLMRSMTSWSCFGDMIRQRKGEPT